MKRFASLTPVGPRSGAAAKALIWSLAMASLVVVGVVGYATYFAGRTIFELLLENKQLRQAITNLTQEDQIGYAKVLGQEARPDGSLATRLLFVETDPRDKSRRLLEREYEIEGDVVHFDALIVKFGTDYVMDGRERALYLWRRVYGETIAPADGYPIQIPGQEPARYRDLCKKLSVRDRDTFWKEIWQLSDDPGRLAESGVRAIYGSAVYKQLRPGSIYVFRIGAGGDLFIETVPDL